jgi:hypothetical protein
MTRSAEENFSSTMTVWLFSLHAQVAKDGDCVARPLERIYDWHPKISFGSNWEITAVRECPLFPFYTDIQLTSGMPSGTYQITRRYLSVPSRVPKQRIEHFTSL